MRALYEPFTRNRDRMIVMDVRSSELTKYAANAMLATKISFMNELANLAEHFGADIESVRIGIGSDPAHRVRLHLSRGRLRRLVLSQGRQGAEALGRRKSATMPSILAAVESGERAPEDACCSTRSRRISAICSGKTIAVWGLAFKPNTDDMREAPSRVLMEALWAGRRQGAGLRSGGHAGVHAHLRTNAPI